MYQGYINNGLANIDTHRNPIKRPDFVLYNIILSYIIDIRFIKCCMNSPKTSSLSKQAREMEANNHPRCWSFLPYSKPAQYWTIIYFQRPNDNQRHAEARNKKEYTSLISGAKFIASCFFRKQSLPHT